MTSPHAGPPAGESSGLDGIAEICAAGGHHLSVLGRPGPGMTDVAGYLAEILPDLTADQASDLAAIRCAAGLATSDGASPARPPLVNPHHTCSVAAMTGDGRPIRPGALAQACHGVLYLQDAPEFPRALLDTLRQPLEYGHLTLARADQTVTFPARFILVIDASPCPCRSCAPCTCSPAQARRYLGRLTGPLLDRIDIKASITSPAGPTRHGVDTSAAAGRVLAARERAAARLDGTGFVVNAQIPARDLFTRWRPQPGALTSAEQARDRGQLSDRGVAKVARIAWTIADLAGRDRPGRADCDQALSLYLGDLS
jgi:magnesium chelatase family protein